MFKRILLFIVLISLVGLGIYSLRSQSKPPSTTSQNTSGEEITVVARDLNIPWEVVFILDGETLITERPGNLIILGPEKKIIKVEGVEHIGEGGLLGLALHPNFSSNNFLYLYKTTRINSQIINQVERYTFRNNELLNRQVIISGIKGASNHNGGRLAFGPDGYLYITTGDAGQENLAQDTNSLNGKILRVKDDGEIPNDNPFGNAVYSYGHRNPQGLAWDDQGRLWATEHGRSGLASGFDELNLIKKGKNYGWPIIQGDKKQEGLVSPVIQSGATETWAPAGLVFKKGSLFYGGLRGETLYEYKIKDGILNKYFQGQFGRIRAVVLGPDGFVYITTSNRDGRGKIKEGDDKLIKINPR